MTANRVPTGVFAPVATIFDAQDELDLAAFAGNLETYVTTELDGIVFLGSNGEFATLSRDEKLRLIETGTSTIAGRKVTLAGTGEESTKGTIALTKAAAALGVDFALIVTPHYYKSRYDKAANLAHYRAVADASPIPVVIYIMTAYTGVDLVSGIVSELSSHPNIAGIKDSGGNAPKVAEMIAGAAPGFGVLAGSASFLYPALALGATGGILALANVAPNECALLARLFREGKHDEARDLQLKLLAANAAVTSKHGIPGLKVALEAVGMAGGKPRPPILPATQAETDDVRKTLTAAGIGPLR
jgi:4-hydroxy-2-oxoglutarate aldolase